ncbi:hypothetical protein [Psychrosphaera aestuarii]|uniref:hypothetical protein n=1 Tax=Psychrosphaera aestuarii TaxID=1266052 RepID=UPI001B3441E6|nr:hypothetical protein [Psychrosphaera aestuarii]
MIKNWTVTARQIRNSGVKRKYVKKGKRFVATSDKGRLVKNGFINHVNYLADRNRPAHQNTQIHVIYDNAKNILSSIHQRQEYRTINSIRGGGVVNWATSFCLSLPASFDISITKWTGVIDQLIQDVSDSTGLDIDIIKEHTHAVLHDESANIDKHSHVHVLVGNVIDLNVVKSISQKKTLHKIKKGFNSSVKKLWNVDHNNYVPKNQNLQNKPLWLARQEKLKELTAKEQKSEESLQEYEQKIINAQRGFNLVLMKLKKIKKLFEKWAFSFLQEQFILANKAAKPLSDGIQDIGSSSRIIKEDLENTIKSVEENIPNAPSEAKVTPKLKNKSKPKR